MKFSTKQNTVIRYRGFILLEQNNYSWKVQPERSPILLMPFRTQVCSLEEVKAIIDMKLNSINLTFDAA
tara:strand:- start:1269 stop:1475 length:207 start_codon:yes stop_codon:yes gene_type:complete